MKVHAQQLSLLEIDDTPKAAPSKAPTATRRQQATHRDNASETPPRSTAEPGPRATPVPTTSAASALLTTEEVAGLLHVHPRTVQRLVERGQLSAIHLGSAVRFDPDDLGGLITGNKQHGNQAAPATDRIRAGRGARTSFADRLRSERHEHRAAHA